jgi:hypothetical protein
MCGICDELIVDAWSFGCSGGHANCKRCVVPWVALHATCPQCQGQVRGLGNRNVPVDQIIEAAVAAQHVDADEASSYRARKAAQHAASATPPAAAAASSRRAAAAETAARFRSSNNSSSSGAGDKEVIDVEDDLSPNDSEVKRFADLFTILFALLTLFILPLRRLFFYAEDLLSSGFSLQFNSRRSIRMRFQLKHANKHHFRPASWKNR